MALLVSATTDGKSSKTYENWANRYNTLGYVLTALRPGKKRPKLDEWGKIPLNPADLLPGEGLGLNHGLSRTVCLDFDDVELCKKTLEQYGIDIDALEGTPPLYKGNPDRFKAIYRLPDGMEAPSGVIKLSFNGKAVFEIRGCPPDTQAQDVLPPSIHPDTGQPYEWITKPCARDDLPVLPQVFMDIWANFDEHKSILLKALGVVEKAPGHKQIASNPGGKEVVESFNRENTLDAILTRNGYIRKGNRYLSPTSSTNEAGVTIFGDRCYSHHGDVLGDGKPHDAFDVMRLLEFNGDWKTTLNHVAPAPQKPVFEFSATEQLALGAKTQDAVAAVFASKFKNKYIFIHGYGKWFMWNKKFWEADNNGSIMEHIRRLARQLNDEQAVTRASQSFFKGIETICRTDPIFARRMEDFDTDNYLLNCPDGTHDLRTGERKKHNPNDNITLITAVSPEKTGGERTLKFLHEITDGNKETVDFLQITLGAILSGAIEEHWMLFLIGDTARNGKTTLGDLLLYIFGDYGGYIPSSTLMSKRNEEHKTELMVFRGKRLIVASEIEEGSFWAESRLKDLTGEARITARLMHQDLVTFLRTFKLIIYGNSRPQMRTADKAIQARMKTLPFNVSFLGREDGDLPAKLISEASFMLGWLMTGHQRWLDNNKKIGSCPAAEAELDDYLASQSTVDVWIDERCKLHDNSEDSISRWIQARDLYNDYSEWKKERGETPIAGGKFGEKLRTLGFKKGKSNGVRYAGISLISAPISSNYGDHKNPAF